MSNQNNPNSKIQAGQKTQAAAAIPYKKSAFSLVMTVLTWAAAVLSVAILVFLVGFVLIRGVGNITPDLFSLKYTTENASVIPAIVNTLEMTVIALVIAVPIGICAAIFLVEYTNNTGNHPDHRRNAFRYSFYSIWPVRHAVFYHCPETGVFHDFGSPDPGHHGTSPDYAYLRGGAEICAGILPGSQLRTGRRQTENDF